VNNAKEIAREVFGRTDIPNDEDGLMARIKEFATRELTGNNDSIKDLLHEYDNNIRYPGKQVLENGKKLLEQIEKLKDIKSFYDYLQAEKDALLDYEDDVRDIKKFFKTQRTIFDKALDIMSIYEGNRTFVCDPETIQLSDDINKIIIMQSPYSEIYKLPELIESFISQFRQILEDERVPIRASIEADRDMTLADLERFPFKDKYAMQVKNEFEVMLDKLSKTNSILVALGMPGESDRRKQQFIQAFNDEQIRINNENKPVGDASTPPAPVRKTKPVSMKFLFAGTTQISSEADIDRLLTDIRAKLKALLDSDTTIKII
jgi:hypothetical protein